MNASQNISNQQAFNKNKKNHSRKVAMPKKSDNQPMASRWNTQPSNEEIKTLSNLLNKGSSAEAKQMALAMTQRFPKHGFAWKVLGAIYQKQGMPLEAVEAFKKATELMPDAEAHYNLGNVYFDQEQLQLAQLQYQQAVKIFPGFSKAHYNLGSVFKSLGCLELAESSYKQALKLDPKNAQMHFNLGAIFQEQQRLPEAINSYLQALKTQPDLVSAHINLGVVYKTLGRLPEAEKHDRKALSIDSEHPYALNNLGLLLSERGQYAEAEAYLRKALQISPEFMDAYNNLGLALHDMRRWDEAVTVFEKALAYNPNQVAALSNLSITFSAQGLLGKAEACLKQALALDPNFVNLYINLASNFLHQGLTQQAETCYAQALKIQPDLTKAQSNLLFVMNYSAHHNANERLQQARHYNQMVAAKVNTAFTSWQYQAPTKRLRIGLVSGDLHQHAVAYFLENLLQHINAETIELIAYPTDACEDQVTTRLKPYFSLWRPLSELSDQAAAQQIHDDGIHVLLDLSGHSAGNRLPVFAWKPAPVQVSWLGYFATTGMAVMDYFLADEVGVPKANQAQFTEIVKYLPDTRLCFTVPNSTMEVSPLPAQTNGYITFGCFQNRAKVGDQVLALWVKILQALPTAKLRWQCKSFSDAAAREDLYQCLNKLGIHADRLILCNMVEREDYLAAHAEVDMILDTFPFPGGTTTCEALWMGVPTLTLTGDTLIARQGASLLTAAGLTDWITVDQTDYINKAIAYCHDLNQLIRLRANLRAQVLASSLFDAPRFAKNMEKALWEMWDEKSNAIQNHASHQTAIEKQASIEKDVSIEIQYQAVTKEDFERSKKLQTKHSLIVLSATKLSETDFWNQSALGLSLKALFEREPELSAKIAFNNARGLAEIFNEGIEQAENNAILIFIHDDVWIDEANFTEAISAGLEQFDVIGVAGNRRRLPNQPAWAFIDQQFTWDEKSNLSGRVAHGNNALGEVSEFGAVPAECELLDGVFLAAKKTTLNKSKVQFDIQFDFHFYDMDFCRSARQTGLKLGTWPIKLTHQSSGAFGSPHWQEKYQLYLNKWDAGLSSSDEKNNTHELQQAVNEVLKLAIEQQNSGQLEQAEKLYLEIIRIQPHHAEANHNLGVIEAHTKDIHTALPRLEAAVMAMPEHEQFWVSYIDALMQAGDVDATADALELGQKFGLSTSTAQTLAAEFIEAFDLHQAPPQPTQLKNSAQDKASDKNHPSITTLIPAFNTQFIPELLASLVTQTFKSFKVIISDDSPNNEVTKLINSPEMQELKKLLNLKIIEGPQKGGYANTFHLVRNYAHQSDFFHILLDDDIIYPTFYETHMRKHSSILAPVSISARWTANQFGQPLSLPMDESTSQSFSLQFNAAAIFKALIPRCDNKLGEWSHAVFRKEAADSILNPYLNGICYFGLDDIGSFIHATSQKSGIWIPTPLGFFRTHDRQNTNRINNTTIKCAHYAWIAFAIIGIENALISKEKAWQCIRYISHSIRERYSEDTLGISMLTLLDAHHEYSAMFKEDFLALWNSYLEEVQLQKVLVGDLNIQLL